MKKFDPTELEILSVTLIYFARNLKDLAGDIEREEIAPLSEAQARRDLTARATRLMNDIKKVLEK